MIRDPIEGAKTLVYSRFVELLTENGLYARLVAARIELEFCAILGL
jgi:hypothetical protein